MTVAIFLDSIASTKNNTHFETITGYSLQIVFSVMLGKNSIDKSLLIIKDNTAWSIANFRKGLTNSISHTGYSVIALVPEGEYVESTPCRYISVKRAF